VGLDSRRHVLKVRLSVLLPRPGWPCWINFSRDFSRIPPCAFLGFLLLWIQSHPGCHVFQGFRRILCMDVGDFAGASTLEYRVVLSDRQTGGWRVRTRTTHRPANQPAQAWPVEVRLCRFAVPTSLMLARSANRDACVSWASLGTVCFLFPLGRTIILRKKLLRVG
jgi:hypothetical protein